MQIKTGCDLVFIPKFIKSSNKFINLNNNIFLEKIFTSYELSTNNNLTSLAGKFAAKESIIKALDFLNAGDWLNIEIIKLKSGKPIIKLLDSNNLKIVSSDISISHDNSYALATCCFLLENKN